MYYLIKERLEECTREEALAGTSQFVAILSPSEWAQREQSFDMGIDFEPDVDTNFDTQAEANYDSITGTFFIPNRADLDKPEACFEFALDEKGIVFIDSSKAATDIVAELVSSRRWKNPCLSRFLMDFIAQIVKNDTKLLRGYEHELDQMEDAIMADNAQNTSERINEMRNELRDLDDHYNHLMDLVQVLEENENKFFSKSDLRYFRIAYSRLDKMRDQAKTLRDQALQMRDLYKMHLDIQQNHIMTVLTVVTAIFAPLTLIVGWYGMNFTHMPELDWPWGYPLVIAVCAAIAIGCFVFFKRRKWL